MEMWILDYQYGFAGKDYFQSLVQRGYLSTDGYQKIVGEAYVPTQPTA